MSEDAHSSDNLIDHPSLRCMTCNGPIGNGEPVSISVSGTLTYISHRFTTDCEWHKDPKNLALQDSEWLAELGISS